ncbi:hypothetical protein [Mycobacterium sp. 48b]|uniref:hypothetical protein n=1 Tax=Mycobacterium sp. 48b TaxID=3400426 RepID=UPI003AAA5767
MAAWTEQPYEDLLALSGSDVEGVQRQALAHRFDTLRPSVEALDKLASRQGVDTVAQIDDVVPVLFDHRVYKSYPLSLVEKRQFPRLSAWLDRLTSHDLRSIPLDGVDSVDGWLARLDEHGMIMGHSTGTTGKLSFIPRSRQEWPAWCNAYFECMRATVGVDLRKVQIPSIATGYRSGHQMMTKMGALFAAESAGGDANRHMLYDYPLSSDLLSLAGRLHAAEERGELDQLEIDPRILQERQHLIEAARHRDEDMQNWFAKLAVEFRGQRVMVGGTAADLVRLAMKGKGEGVVADFGPDSILVSGGGMKGFKDAPDNWRELLMDFFNANRIRSMYGMSETMVNAPQCEAGFFHVLPYVIPIILDEEANPLPRHGVQTGRMALYDLLAETYWGGFISGDKVTVHWDSCECGWNSPRVAPDIVRFSDIVGGEDKITCAGTAKAYNDFMDYVSGA